MQTKSKRRASRGFTLIELLVVIAIIAILAAMLLPALTKAREKAKTTRCTGMRKEVGIFVQQYTQDWGDVCPPASWGAQGTYERWYAAFKNGGYTKQTRMDQFHGCYGKPGNNATPTPGSSIAYNYRLHPTVPATGTPPKPETLSQVRLPAYKFVIADYDGSGYWFSETSYRVSRNYNPAMASVNGFYPWHNQKKSGTMLYLDGHVEQLFPIAMDIPTASGYWYMSQSYVKWP